MKVCSIMRAARPVAASRSRFRPWHAAAPLLAALAVAASAHADLVIDSGDPFNPDDDLVLDIQGVVGEGIFSSYMVVDFGATGGDSYAWEWRWNPGDDARGATMLLAILESTDLDGILGGEDGQGFGIFVENFTLPGAGEAGDPSAFWSYWTAEAEDVDPGIAWSEPQVGASFRELSNGSIDGWYNGFDGTQPAVPVTLVPGPAALGLMIVAGLGAGRRRRDPRPGG
jgi:MYXO-CTERM domain-containing protein